MLLDTTQYLAAVTPPVLVIEGREHVGRLLSIHEWLRLQPLMVAIEQDTAPPAEAARHAWVLLDAMFPPPPAGLLTRLRRAWRDAQGGPAASVAAQVTALPWAIARRILLDCIASQVHALDLTSTRGATTATGPAPSPGTASPAPISTTAGSPPAPTPTRTASSS